MLFKRYSINCKLKHVRYKLFKKKKKVLFLSSLLYYFVNDKAR